MKYSLYFPLLICVPYILLKMIQPCSRAKNPGDYYRVTNDGPLVYQSDSSTLLGPMEFSIKLHKIK